MKQITRYINAFLHRKRHDVYTEPIEDNVEQLTIYYRRKPLLEYVMLNEDNEGWRIYRNDVDYYDGDELYEEMRTCDEVISKGNEIALAKATELHPNIKPIKSMW